MLEILKRYANHNNWMVIRSDQYGELDEVEWVGDDDLPWKLAEIAVAKAEEGNKRRAAGNVELPDRRGMK